MPTVTRNSVFETNSSSTHSICIADSCDVVDRLPVDDGVCRVYPGEFGWEVHEYRDVAEKSSYALVHAKSFGLGRLGKECSARIKMLSKVIESEMGVTCEFKPATDEYYPWGYIDHQSIENDGGAGEPMWKDEGTLRRFLFSKNSVLVTDNDNH